MAAYLILMAGAFLAAAISGAAGFGGALPLLPLLTRTVGVAEAMPLLTIAQLAGNLARVGFGYQSIARRPVLISWRLHRQRSGVGRGIACRQTSCLPSDADLSAALSSAVAGNGSRHVCSKAIICPSFGKVV